MIAAIDSMVLIYAGQVPRKPGAKPADELAIRAKLLLHILKGVQIILPAISISELLVPVAESQKGGVVAALSKRFHCPPFDLHAAVIASNLWAEHQKSPRKAQYDDRRVLKADAMIVASAKAAGATDFYTHDGKCRALAANVMKAHDLPTRDPTDMFALDDIKRGEL